jgi:predicted RNA-binding Zn ribbon-like protein
MAEHVARFGTTRLGTCASDPCHCAFVDRTRGATRRYCRTRYDDRAVARAYRKRRNSGQRS